MKFLIFFIFVKTSNMEFGRELYINKLLSRRNNGKIKVLTGINSVGKSYLLFEIFLNYLLDHKCDRNHIFRIDLMERCSEQFRNSENLISHIESKLIDKRIYYVLIDEIQLIDSFGLLLDNCSKFKNVDFYVTGSDTRFFTDILCENCDVIEIFPLTFKEFLQIYKGEISNHLEEYLLYGGLPSVSLIRDEEMKKEYLEAIYKYTIFTKINEHYKINKFDVMEILIDTIAVDIGAKTNYTILCNSINSNNKDITKLSLRTYMKIINKYFLLNRIQSLNAKRMRNSHSPVKYYYTDLGMRNIRIHFNVLDKAYLIENMIYNELRVRDYEVNTGFFSHYIKYQDGRLIRKHYDIDFVCIKNNEIIYIQICQIYDKIKTDILMKISDKAKKVIIINEHEPTHKNENGILMLNLYDFLLNENILNEL